ncbi:MAG: TolC family protein, partial [Synechococcaceae cyanobacterium]|nr:TolC family protein [Synechococcaceae cyanobacterium]
RLALLPTLPLARSPLPLLCAASPAWAARPQSTLYGGSLAELESILRQLERFDAIVEQPDQAAEPAAALSLPAPPAQAVPRSAEAVTVRRQQRLSLAQAVALAVSNSPALARNAAAVERQRALLRAAWSRYAPTLSLSLAGQGGQYQFYEKALQGNTAIYAPSSPFYVESGRWKSALFSSAGGLVDLSETYVVLDPARSAALAGAKDSLQASLQTYADRLRQLQLEISETYYAIQLAQQRLRIREAEVFNQQAVRDQARALLASGLVPRVDLLRAEAQLQQSRFQLAQVEADLLSNQRLLSNQVNVPFDVSLLATEPVRLQPPWPLDLSRTLVAGFQDNPQLRAIEAARSALLRQADEQAAALLPRLSVYVSAQFAPTTTAQTNRVNTGCCGAAVIPETFSSSLGWAAGVRLNWTLMDGGVSRAQADASRAEARGVAEQQAEQRNAIRQRLEQAFFSHQASLSQVIAARASLKAAREAFRDMRARYQLGLADYTDVSATILSLTRALEDKATAITTANLSYARMLRDLLPVPRTPAQPVELPITLPPDLSAGSAAPP